jgi:uncharacterized protein YPO0396
MQLNVFSTDNQKSGFRLQYMEVYNWGTFDEIIHTIQPGGETSLLTGANGSGKTTFVDALLTLIVPEKKYRFYNQSSGSEKKGDRTEDSYVLGGFGEVNSEQTGSTKTQYLRNNKEEAYSILLVHFANEAAQFVTLFQVRYYAKGEMKKVFGVAHKPLRIEEDFKPFDLGGNWKKNLEIRYNKGTRKLVEWFDSASKYAKKMVEVLGMQSIQAIQLFNQTVGIKVLGNLDEFIRRNMLEPRDIETQFQDLKSHLSTLLAAKKNIEKAEKQIELLKKIKFHHEDFIQIDNNLKAIDQALHTALIWKNYTQYNLIQNAIAEKVDVLQEIKQKLDTVAQLLNALAEEERNLRNQIENNKAGQRLQQLERDHSQQQEALSQAEKSVQLFLEWCKTMQINDLQPTDENSYRLIKKENDRKILQLVTQKRLNDDDDYEARKTVDDSEKQLKIIEAELNSLLYRKNNIPGYLIDVRKQLCDALDISPYELPFAGELMQVKSSEHLWQPTLEKLLHAFALRLVVPDKYYKKVNKYVNNNNLRTRLVYEHVVDAALNIHPDEGTVIGKLDLHPDHQLTNWISFQLIKQFDFFCIDDEKTMERYDKAITVNGLIKNRLRHEKDDRPNSNDPSKYVLGWDNERKKEKLLQQRNKLGDAISTARELAARCRNKAQKIEDQQYAATRIKEQQSFTALDVTGLQRNIHDIQKKIEALRQDNKVLDQLTEQLQDCLKTRGNNQQDQTQWIREQAILENDMALLNQKTAQLHVIVEQINEDEQAIIEDFKQNNAQILGEITLDNIEQGYNSIKEEKTKAKNQHQFALTQAEKALQKSISFIKRPAAEILAQFPDWLGDVQQLSDETQYATEYVEWMDKLEKENLPTYKKQFENYINDTVTYKIGGLSEDLNKWESDINYSIGKLNDSLGKINFNRLPDTYIQLSQQQQPAGTEIRMFKKQLLDAHPQIRNWQQSSFEEKSLHFTQKILPLINKLDTDENYRSKVLDVRNWFEYWAEEKYRENGELKKTYRQMGQLSGGEKAQLTYTILCSAIAYQFGITREGRNSKSLRFIAVDESFSNQDEEKATYLMELCKQLHLQLLVVTPSDKIQIVQDYIAHVHLVQRVNNRNSVMYNMTIKELQDKLENNQLVE